MSAAHLRPGHKILRNYYETRRLYSAHNVQHESALRHAFLTLLDQTARLRRWAVIQEYRLKVSGRVVIPDAVVEDDYHLHRGFYEAKDSRDDLDLEIRRKLALGYPSSNIIFEDNARAVLYQNNAQAQNVELDNEHALSALLNTFYEHRQPDIDGFENAIARFSEDVPRIGQGLAEKVSAAHRANAGFRASFDSFLSLCRQSLNPNLRAEAVDEMLVQHLLTERLIRRVFDQDDFDHRNAIASEVERVIHALTSSSFSRNEFLRSLDPYYAAIESAASTLPDFSAKQHFINTVYERFFQGYCVRTADTHGIVYTPQPIVDFMCRSVEDALAQHFDKPLGSEGTYILDPCTGTGNFVVNLIQRIPARCLERMYRDQLFANEVMLMPYYIASLNIERAYFDRTGHRAPFEGLSFVDTLDMAEGQQMAFFAEANTARVQRQKDAPINVIIGNPPYNVGQQNENDNNKNRKYPVIDQRIRGTYSKDSAATSKSKLNDAYVKFFRWASDRIGSRDGVLCFVTNNGFVDQHAFDGMRKHLAADFHLIDHLDLHGNVRKNPKLSGTTHNVFGIQVGVGITLAIRKSGEPRHLRYHRVPELWTKEEKLASLSAPALWSEIRPSEKFQWIIPDNSCEFSEYPSIASLFDTYCLGVNTNRDDVVYNFQEGSLSACVQRFISDYNAEVFRYHRAGCPADVDGFVSTDRIKWSSTLKLKLVRGVYVDYDRSLIRRSLYRPFSERLLYYDQTLVHRPGTFSEVGFPLISLTGIGSDKPFMALIAGALPDLHLVGAGAGSQNFPLSHLSDSALASFRTHYADPDLAKPDIFHYLYALLHHPAYRARYAEALKKELPRIPFAPDFESFRRIGAILLDLHLNYENLLPHPLTVTETPGVPYLPRVEGKMKLSKDRRGLSYNSSVTLSGIPEDVFNYSLGHRSALEWVIDQYQLKRDAAGNVTSDPNRADDPEYILRLIGQVITVSLETNRLTAELELLPFLP